MLVFSTICLGLLSGLVASQDPSPVDPENSWLSRPPGQPGQQSAFNISVYKDNAVWTINQTYNLIWRAKFPVLVQCYQDARSGRSLQVYNGTDDHYYWNANINETWLNDGDVFFFGVLDSTKPRSAPVFYSHYFNITKTATASSPSNTVPPIFPAQPQGGNSTGGGSSSNGAAIGAGVGGGVAALIIAGLVFWCLYRRRRNKRQNNVEAPVIHEAPSDMPSPAAEMPSPPPTTHHEKQAHFPFHGSFAPNGYNFSPPQSPEPAPAYKPTYELSDGEEHPVRHELDSTGSRR